MKRLTRTQLRRMIIAETRMIQEDSATTAALSAYLTSTPLMGPASSMVQGLVLGKALEGQAKDLYDSMDPRIQKAIDGLVIAVKALPGKMKESAIESLVATIEDATEAID